jgi:hypothetical protein
VVLFSHGVSIGCTVETVTDVFRAQSTTVRGACTKLRFAPYSRPNEAFNSQRLRRWDRTQA